MPKVTGNSRLTRLALPLVVFGLGSLGTLGFLLVVQANQQKAVSLYFDNRSRDAASRIEARLVQYEQALLAARGLLESVPHVGREQFASYVSLMEVGARYPGIQGIGYSVLVRAPQLASHLQRVRAEGFPEYTIKPPGRREVYSSVLYLEPFSVRNQRAFGYDMYLEPVRRLAMDRAADTGTSALSGKVQLVQESTLDVQPGFLMYLSVQDPTTHRVIGWVFAPFRAEDFMQGILGGGRLDLDLKLYDGNSATPETLLYQADAKPPTTVPDWTGTQTLTFGGRVWTLVVRSLPGVVARHGPDAAGLVLWIGGLLTLLLALSAAYVRRNLDQARFLNAKLEETVKDRTVELSLREERLATIIEGTHVGTWEWNVRTGETVFNERWAEIAGYTLEELAPISIETWVRLAHPDDLKESDRLLKKVFARQDRFYDFESRMRHKDGSWVWVLDRGAVATWTDDGQPLMMRGTHTDITQRKQAEDLNLELANRNHQLEKNASLARMASSIAHHFNNKLQAVTANLELAEAAPGNQPASKYVTHAREAAEKAAEVSRLLLIYLGQSPAAQVPTLLTPVVKECIARFQAALDPRLLLQGDLAAPGPTVNANAGQIDQLLSALLTNAIEAVPGDSGSIQVRLTKAPADQIPQTRFPLEWIPAAPEYACLEVLDNGSGVETENLENLFDPFFSTKFPGRGLGLSVALGIVQSHRGVISVESLPRLGTVFRVFLPTLQDVAKPEAPPSPAPAAPVGKTILLVDDDEELLEPTQELLELLGYRVTVARDGLEALELYRREAGAIHGVITDLTMPHMDGWELLSALRALAPGLPVILASGYDRGEVMAGEHRDYPEAFLGKPFNLTDLGRTLRELLG